MEDEKGDVGLVCSAGVSGSPVVVDLASKTLRGVIEGEKQIGDPYEEDRDVGEVMVEVVGSDVFVDGVSGQGVFVAGEAGDLEGHTSENQDFRGSVDASHGGGRSDLEESKVVLMLDEPKHVAENKEAECDESATELSFSGVAVVNDDSCDHGVSSTGILSSLMPDPVTEQSEKVIVRTSVVVIDDKLARDEAVDNASSSDNVKPEFLNTPVEVVVEGEGDVGKVKVLDPAKDSAPCLDFLGADSVLVDEATDTGACVQVASTDISLNSNGEDCVVEEVGLFNSSAVDTIEYGDIDPGHSVDLNLCASVSDVAAPFSSEEVASSGRLKGEILRTNVESASTNGDGGKEAKEGKAIVTETENLILKLDDLVPNDHGNNEACIEDFDVTRGIDGISNAVVESSCGPTVATEKPEAIVMDSDDVLDFNDGEFSFANKNECLNTDSDIEKTGVVQKDYLSSKEPTHLDGGVSTAAIRENKGLSIGILPDIDNNLLNTINSSCVGDDKIIEADSLRSADQPLIVTSDAEVIDDVKFALSEAKVSAGDGTRESGEEIDGSNVAKTSTSDMITPNVEVVNSGEADDNSEKNNGVHIMEDHISDTTLMDVDEEIEFEAYDGEKEESYMEDPAFGTEEPAYESENFKFLSEEPVKSASSLRMNQPSYLSPPLTEGEFSLSDLVWGKVRSYPWWPGQIFDPADASERAVKHYKKDSHLVAYFGDRTFAWNDASVLKPFRPHFSQIEKQSNSEAFQNAVDCALEEVARRVELGLACSCVPEDAYDMIKTQVVENTGIHEESSLRTGVDQSTGPSAFEPDKLLEYVRDLSPRASSGADRLDLVIARAQLSAFCCFKGYRLPTVFPSSGELLETDVEETSDDMVVSHKSKHIPKDSFQSRKERSLTELMGDAVYSPDGDDELLVAKEVSKSISSSSSKKRKALDPLADGSERRLAVPAAKVTISANQTPKPSFKIGECIRRVACQLTGSTSMVKGLNDETVDDGSLKAYEQSERQNMDVSRESSLNEMLSQLQLVAQDPKKRHNFLNTVITFFKGFRSSSALNRRGRKKRAAPAAGGSAEDFEFDDVNDSYWTDRIVQNYSEEQLLHNCENGADHLQVVSFDAEKSVKPGRKSHSRKRFSTRTYPTTIADSDEIVRRKKQESSPAELILNFEQRNCVPSEINLNKMFRRFGPLMESETEVDHESGRAKVIFKRGSDAEVAHNSAEKFNIFGPALVTYEIGYTPLISVKILPLAVPPPCQEDPTLLL